LLIYISFFTSEKRNQRRVKRIQKLFNTQLQEPTNFEIDDPRNDSHPEEMVCYNDGLTHRKLAVLLYQSENEI